MAEQRRRILEIYLRRPCAEHHLEIANKAHSEDSSPSNDVSVRRLRLITLHSVLVRPHSRLRLRSLFPGPRCTQGPKPASAATKTRATRPQPEPDNLLSSSIVKHERPRPTHQPQAHRRTRPPLRMVPLQICHGELAPRPTCRYTARCSRKREVGRPVVRKLRLDREDRASRTWSALEWRSCK